MRLMRAVPPSPVVTSYLVNEYHARWKKLGLTFGQFLQVSGYANPAHDIEGMDDHTRGIVGDDEVMLLAVPRRPVRGDLHVIVLLVDFPDLEGSLPKEHYSELLFSRQTYVTGSLADYYDEVSRGQVNLEGEIYGWLRMPHKYTYYTNGHSGLTDLSGCERYPRDARKLAEDAVEAALANGVKFASRLDVFEDRTVTALFVVHAGQGAEKLFPALRSNHIWSHKWNMKQPKWVATDLWVTTYLMVPQEALLGVYAHELGHLAFQWQDFYDPHYDEDGNYWDGSGIWDLMASGAYAGEELRPVHPAGLHKLQHGWIDVEEIQASQSNVILKPVTTGEGKVIKIHSPHYKPNQYLLLENRAREAFDRALPGEGLLVWRIDESERQEGCQFPGMLLIQADGHHYLQNSDDRHIGDPGDPFPGATGMTMLSDQGTVSTSFPGGPASGVTLRNMTHDPTTKELQLDIDIQTS